MNDLQPYAYRAGKDTSDAPVFSNLENQMSAINQLGEAITKSGFAGCERIEQGIIVAFTCLAEKITPIEFARTYDIIQGKPTKKAAVMLAEFRSIYGGEFEWVDDGEDGKKATIALTYKGKEKKPVTFTIEEAKAKGLSGKSNWKQHLPEMLRARASTKALRMHVPEIAAGIYDPHELGGYDSETPVRDVRLDVAAGLGVLDLKANLEIISEELQKKAQDAIFGRFEVKAIEELTNAQVTKILNVWDTFIEGLSSDGSS